MEKQKSQFEDDIITLAEGEDIELTEEEISNIAYEFAQTFNFSDYDRHMLEIIKESRVVDER